MKYYFPPPGSVAQILLHNPNNNCCPRGSAPGLPAPGELQLGARGGDGRVRGAGARADGRGAHARPRHAAEARRQQHRHGAGAGGAGEQGCGRHGGVYLDTVILITILII